MLLDNPVLLQLKRQSEENKAKDTKENKTEEKRKNNRVSFDTFKSNYSKNNDNNDLYKQGTVKTTDKGYGFLEVDFNESYFIAPNNMKQLMHGDVIRASIVSNGDKSQAYPIDIIEPVLKRFVAKVSFRKNNLVVIPNDLNIHFPISAKSEILPSIKLKEGDWVICSLVEHALSNNNRHFASITEFVAHENDQDAPWWVVLRGLDLPKSAPNDLLSYTYQDESSKRIDLTNLPFVTIDSAKTKDMDDALYIEEAENGWCLYVAIADPTGYISENDELNKEAVARSFSIYLPGRDIPMLPRTLSDDLCSLWEGTVRHTLVLKMFITLCGEVSNDYEFMLADIKSQGKLVYDEVSDFLEGIESSFKPNSIIENQVRLLESFAKARAQYRAEKTSIFKDRPEYEFVLNQQGGLDYIKIVYRRIANKIVEEAMIVSNMVCGRFLAKKYGLGIFNTHNGFDEEKINDLISILKDFNAPIQNKEELLTIDGFSSIKRWSSTLEPEISNYIDSRLRKYQNYAQMQVTPAAHYGLGLDYYATWTSPIRKYGDMINHRLIKASILDNNIPTMPNEDVIFAMNVAKKHNRQAERQVKDWLYVDYLKPHLKMKTEFEAEVFDILRSGVRFHLLENGATVFMNSSSITDDKRRLDINTSLGKIKLDNIDYLQVGQIVKVIITSIDEDLRIIYVNKI